MQLDKVFSVLDDLCQGSATLLQWNGGMTGHLPPLEHKVNEGLPYPQGRNLFTSIVEMGVQSYKVEQLQTFFKKSLNRR